MEVEDGARWIRDLRGLVIDQFQELVLGQLPRRVPGRGVRIADADHRKPSGQFDQGSFRVDHTLGGAQQRIDEGRIVVAGRHEAQDVAPVEPLFGQRQPALDGLGDALLEDRIHRVGRSLERLDSLCVRFVGVVAGVGNQFSDGGHLCLAELAVAVEDPGRPTPTTMVDDWHQHLPGHVAAHDQDLAVVEAGRIQELPKAPVGGVDVGHEEGAVISHRRSPPAARTRPPVGRGPPVPAIE